MPTFGRPRRPLGPLVLLLLTLNAAYIIASAPAPSDQAWPWRRSGGRLAAHGRPGPRRTLASHRQAESVNITATHKGEWKRLAWPARLADVGLLQQAGGIAVLKLRNLGRPEVRGSYAVPAALLFCASQTLLSTAQLCARERCLPKPPCCALAAGRAGRRFQRGGRDGAARRAVCVVRGHRVPPAGAAMREGLEHARPAWAGSGML